MDKQQPQQPQQPIKYENALPSRPASMGIQRGRLSASGNSVGRTVNIHSVLQDFQETYTDTCFRRTAPYGGTMPLAFERWLRAVDLATSEKGNKGNYRAKASAVASYFGQVDKNSDNSYVNLCHMTAEPFPLISSGRAATSDSMNSKAQPLIDPQTYFATAQRYARVTLSELGKLAVRWYKKYKMQDISQHRSIIPLSLLRKTQVVTLGFKTEMRPLNPSEIFYLMAKLIEYYDRSTKQWHDISDADIAEYFKGPDLGDGYIIFMSDEALMSLYSAGRASIMAVPDIKINIEEGTVIFQRPVLDQATRELGKYFLRKLEANMQAVDPKPIYKSFTYDDCDVNGNYTTLKGCNFFGNAPETIKAELWADVRIQKRTVVTNVILEPRKDESKPAVLVDEGIHYQADCKSIPETLRMHILWERECRLKDYHEQKQYLLEELRVSKLLEKVTRPPVAQFVHSIMSQPNRKATLLMELGKESQSDLRKTAFHDGVYFTKDEVDEIFRERTGSTVVAGSKIQILAILFKRDEYKDLWINIEKQLAEVQAILDNPDVIYDFIYAELIQWVQKDEWRRKSTVYFLDDAGVAQKTAKDALAYYTAPSPAYDKLNMPCSIYYNHQYMAKSYGANMNVLLNQNESSPPTRVLNCTTQDYVGILHGTKITYTPVSAIPTSAMYMGDVIKAIIPYSTTSRLMVNIVKYEVDGGNAYMKTSYYRIVEPQGWLAHPKTGVEGLDIDEFVEGFVYLDDGATHVDVRTVKGMKRVPIGEIPTDSMLNPYPLFFGTVTDLHAVYDVNEGYPLYLPNYTDRGLERTDKTKESVENGWLGSPRVLTGNYGARFSTSMEFYYKTIYLSNWTMLNTVIEQRLTHGKKSVIPENRWLRPGDALSKLIQKRLLAENASTQGTEIQCILSAQTSAYRTWNIDQLEDWSVIDRRFGCQSVAPRGARAMQVYLDYMEERFKGTTLNNTVPTAVIAAKGLLADDDGVDGGEGVGFDGGDEGHRAEDVSVVESDDIDGAYSEEITNLEAEDENENGDEDNDR